LTYSHRNIAEEQKEARQQAKQITAICEQFHITLDPIDWQNAGMRACVTVNAIKIADLLDFARQDSTSILRQVQIKLLEHAALETLHTQLGHRALVWSPVEVIQPQEFLSLWIVTLETDERIAIAEYIKNGQRAYEPYELDMDDEYALTKLFGPVHTGEYQLGDTVTIGEHGQQWSGEIIYILPPSKAFMNSKGSSPDSKWTKTSRGHHTILGKVHMNDASARYLVDCHDGFPHVVNQWQVISEISER